MNWNDVNHYSAIGVLILLVIAALVFWTRMLAYAATESKSDEKIVWTLILNEAR